MKDKMIELKHSKIKIESCEFICPHNVLNLRTHEWECRHRKLGVKEIHYKDVREKNKFPKWCPLKDWED